MVPQSAVLMESVLKVGSDARHIPASPGAPLYTALCRNDVQCATGGSAAKRVHVQAVYGRAVSGRHGTC